MNKFTVKLIPGDGIGVDVIREALRVLNVLAEQHGGVKFDFQELEWSCQYYLKTGRMMPEDGLKILSDCDSILLGAVGFPGVPDHVSLRELLLPIRVGFDQYVNLRPVKLLNGAPCPLKDARAEDVPGNKANRFGTIRFSRVEMPVLKSSAIANGTAVFKSRERICIRGLALPAHRQRKKTRHSKVRLLPAQLPRITAIQERTASCKAQ